MKIVHNSIFRALCAVVIGALLIKYRDQTVTWLTIAIGVLFFLAGIVSVASYISDRRIARQMIDNADQASGVKPQMPFPPVVGFGSIALGVILTMMPSTFVNILLYILSAMLIIGAISQYVSLASASKIARIGVFYWIMPSLILIVSIYTMVHPQEVVATTQFIIGWSILVYGIVECINSIKIARLKKRLLKELKTQSESTEVVEAEVVSEEPADAQSSGQQDEEKG